MHARLDFFGKSRIHHTMRVEAAFADEGLRHNFDAEMASPIGSRSGMARMQMRFIDDVEHLRLKDARKLVLDMRAKWSECHDLLLDQRMSIIGYDETRFQIFRQDQGEAWRGAS